MLPSMMVEIRYYVDSGGREPFADWFSGLDGTAKAKVVRAVTRMEQGNLSNVKSVGEGVLELRIDRAGLSRVFRARRRYADPAADRRHEEAPAAGHRGGSGLLARLQRR